MDQLCLPPIIVARGPLNADTESARGRRRRHDRAIARRGRAGQGFVEFALVAPIAFLLLLGIIVASIAVANQNLLANGVRDTARAAAVCGGLAGRTLVPQPPLVFHATMLPAAGAVPAQTCSWPALDTYAQARLTQLVGGSSVSAPAAPAGTSNCQTLPSGSALVCLYDGSNNRASFTGNPLDSCQRGYKIEISSQFAQPLYIPLVGIWLGSNGSSTSRTLSADVEATCEQ